MKLLQHGVHHALFFFLVRCGPSRSVLMTQIRPWSTRMPHRTRFWSQFGKYTAVCQDKDRVRVSMDFAANTDLNALHRLDLDIEGQKLRDTFVWNKVNYIVLKFSEK